MKKHLYLLLVCLFGHISFAAADAPVDDGVYYISNATLDGYLGLGTYHDVAPYIYYVTDGMEKTEDAYWQVVNTRSGYTFRNEATGQMLVFTYDRVDAYYKYMTLADEAPEDGTEYWNLEVNDDGTISIQSIFDTAYYWNLRSGAGLMGTYAGSSRNWNERFVFHKKGDGPDPGPGPDPQPEPVAPLTFPEALHVTLADGHIEAYPLEYITSYAEQDGKLVIQTNIGQTFTYALTEVSSVSETRPTDFPTFESFKFNNKFNDQLFTDAEGEMVEDTVFVTLAAIGKRLTPSFKVPDDGVEVYVNGQLQSSKESRLRFDKDIYYVVTRSGNAILLPDGDEKGGYSMQPYGRVVRVHVDWLTDRAEVPRIDINTFDGLPITSKTEYKDAEITIDGRGIFPSMETTAVQIKGRGNSSWGWEKKPYRLKFEEKVKPLGMTKGKSWVLLANGQRGSLMSNAIGMKAANLMQAAAANHIMPVDVYLNGEYRGSYNLTEKIGFSNNSIDLNDDSAAALLELDSYYDEPDGQKFRSTPYNLPINVKEPDFSEGTTSLTLEDVSDSFNRFLATLYRGQNLSRYVDIEQLVRFLMVNELILNYELYHPKSTFCYCENFESDTSKYVFGPVWDLDWAFGYERYGNYFANEAESNYWIDMPAFEVRDFVRDLRFKYLPIDEMYRRLWKQFMDNDLQELMEYCQDYYDFAHNSFDENRQRWGDRTDYGQQAQDAAQWLESRSQRIYDDILEGKRPDIPVPVGPIYFENDKLYSLTCRRGALVLNEDHTGLDAGQTRTDAPEEDRQFAILHIDGQNYLYSPVTRQFLSCQDDGVWVSELGSPITFDSSQPDGEYLYMLSSTDEYGQTIYFNNNTEHIVINSWDTADDGNRWLIEEVADFDPSEALELAASNLVTITHRYLFNGQVVATETFNKVWGSEPPKPSATFTNSYVSLKEPDDLPFTITDDTTLDYEVQWTGPFQFATSLDDARWYNMTIRSNYHVSRQDMEPYVPYVADEMMLSMPEFQWAFGGNPYHVLIYNRSTGFDETLTLDGTDGVMRPGEYSWELLPNDDGFVLREPGTEYACLNQIGGAWGPLQTWNDRNSPTDNGSTFRVSEALVDGMDMVMYADGNDAVYDLSGRKMSNVTRSALGSSRKWLNGKLPRGIYIRNGKRYVVR